MDIGRFARRMSNQPIPFGAQVLFILGAHALLTSLAARGLTVTKFLAAAREAEAVYERIDQAVLAIVLGLTILFWVLGRRPAFRRMVLVYLVGVTITLFSACFELVSTLAARGTAAGGAFGLLGDALLTWTTNVLTFTVWYWFLDQGGPDRRHSSDPGPPDFAFPQQTNTLPGWESWTPGLLDYLFLAFNTSTAFSPTDTSVLSTSAKALCMVQATISLVIIAILAARVVNMI